MGDYTASPPDSAGPVRQPSSGPAGLSFRLPTDTDGEVAPVNALASMLAEHILALSAARAEIERLTEALVKAETGERWWRRYAEAVQDLNSWLMRRGPGELVRDVVADWHRELDCRAQHRRGVTP